MNVVTDKTKAERLENIRQKLLKTTDSKERMHLAREAREVRGDEPKR